MRNDERCVGEMGMKNDECCVGGMICFLLNCSRDGVLVTPLPDTIFLLNIVILVIVND